MAKFMHIWIWESLMKKLVILFLLSFVSSASLAGEPQFYFKGLNQDKTISAESGKPFRLKIFIAPPEDAKPLDANSKVVKHSQEISNGKIITLTATCSLALQCETGVSLFRIYYDNASQKSTEAT